MNKKARKQNSDMDWDWVMVAIAVLTAITMLYVVGQIIRWVMK